MMNTWKQRWTLVSTVTMCGCQLGVEQLEVGDEADETDDDDDGTGDGDEQPSDECVAQGTNLAGGDEPLDYPLPACEVECATGWGHGATPLASEWTLDLQHQGETTGFTHLGLLPSGELLAMIGWYDAPARLVWISPDGELIDELIQPAIDGDLWDVGIDADGIIYAIWRDDDMQSLTALSSTGEHLWTVELGPHLAYHSVLAPLNSGVVVPLNPADSVSTSQLLRVSAGGQVTSMGPIPITWQVAVSPSGDTVALANLTTISWTDFGLFPSWTSMQGVADVLVMLGLVAIDDQRVVSVGAAKNWDEDGSVHAYVKQIGPMGLDWEHRYDRALSWCPQAVATEEVFITPVQLTDGSLLVVGRDASSNGNDSGIPQPFVVHVSAQGEVLGTDRGFWHGEAVTAAAGADGAAYVLLYEYGGSGQQLHIRKYAP